MAREYAKVWLRILDDPEFRALSRGPQHLYFVLLLSRTVNNAGVADWRPKRMSVIARGWRPEQIEADVAILEEARFVVVDHQAEEILLRSFIRHDGIMSGPKTSQGMASAYRRTTSLKIRGAIAVEVKRLYSEAEDKATKAWEVFDVQQILAEPEYVATISGVSDTPSDTRSVEYPDGMPGVSLEYPLSLEPLYLSTSKPKDISSTAAPSTAPEVDPWLFTEFWKLYPRKVGKEDARRAWARAIKRRKANPDDIVAGAGRYAADPNLPETTFVPHPAKWLNGDRWESGPEPPRPQPRPQRAGPTGQQMSTGEQRATVALKIAARYRAQEEAQAETHQRQIGSR